MQPMLHGVELIAGVMADPLFGPVVMFGSGGTAVELFADRVLRILPLTDQDAHEMVRSIRGAPLLFGHRGATAVRRGGGGGRAAPDRPPRRRHAAARRNGSQPADRHSDRGCRGRRAHSTRARGVATARPRCAGSAEFDAMGRTSQFDPGRRPMAKRSIARRRSWLPPLLAVQWSRDDDGCTVRWPHNNTKEHTMTTGMRWRIFVLQVGLIGILAFVAGFAFWGEQLRDQPCTTNSPLRRSPSPRPTTPPITSLPKADAAAMTGLRRPGADHRCAGRDLRRPLHRRPSQRDRWWPDLLAAERRRAG